MGLAARSSPRAERTLVSNNVSAPSRALVPPAAPAAAPSSAAPAAQRPFGEFLRPPSAAPSPTPPAPSPASAASATEPLTAPLGGLLRRVARGERQVDAVLRQAVSGRSFTPEELLVVQAQVYRYSQELELVGKLVDKGTNTVRTILQQNG